MSDPYFVSGTMYAVADRPEGPYSETPGDNVLYGGPPPSPHSCRSVLFEGVRYVFSTQETAQTNTLSPPMVAVALPDGRLRLAYSPRTQVWRRQSLASADRQQPIGFLIPPLGHWCPLLSGEWEETPEGYAGRSESGWQCAGIWALGVRRFRSSPRRGALRGGPPAWCTALGHT